MSTYKNHILTEKNIVILFDDKTLSYPRSHKLFAKVKKNLQAMNFRDLDLLGEIQVSGKKSSLPSGVTIKAGIVRVDKKRLPDTLEEKIISFWEKGLPLFPIINFYRNMMKNPSEESRKDLFTFLMENRIPITEKGMFRAYKKVREDMTDSQTGKIDNSVGKIVEMPRDQVDADRTVTCSRGLHVASWGYAQGYSGQVILEIQINPKDVVAVPTDYNKAKMRVCRYKVVRVVTVENPKDLEEDDDEPDSKEEYEEWEEESRDDDTYDDE